MIDISGDFLQKNSLIYYLKLSTLILMLSTRSTFLLEHIGKKFDCLAKLNAFISH